MNKLLLLACNYKHRYPKGIPKNIVARLTQLYEQILQRGLSFHSCQSPLIRKVITQALLGNVCVFLASITTS